MNTNFTLKFFLIFLHINYFSILRSVTAIIYLNTPKLLDPPDDDIEPQIEAKFIKANQFYEQIIDHFNPTEIQTWSQRYHLNEQYYVETSKTIFLLLGGEGEATTKWLTNGAWIKSAEKYGALLVYLEHRFYGLSQPFSDLSTQNLKYLSAAQALEDAANFIQGLNKNYNLTNTEAKWIVFGGSYAANLASWLRLKFPHLVTAAVASSGPLEAKLDFFEYLQIVGNRLQSFSQSCADNVKTAIAELEALSDSCLEDIETYDEINTMFQLCDSIESSEGNEEDLTTLIEHFVDNIFAYYVQYDGRFETTIDNLCEIMLDSSLDDSSSSSSGFTYLKKLARVNTKVHGSNCTNYKYAKLIRERLNITIEANSMKRQWLYQTCTEFGFFQTSSSSNQDNSIFGNRLDLSYFSQICTDVFGDEFNETITSLGIKATNGKYGGKNIAASNIVYFHSSTDPWHILGKLETTEDVGDTVIIVKNVAHCANMYNEEENDPQELIDARTQINKLIGKWLGVPDDEDPGNRAFKNIANLNIFYFLIILGIFLLH